MHDEVNLSESQAYRAMLVFLEHFYDLTHSDDLAGLLSGWQLTTDSKTMDPAAWQDWLAAIQTVRRDHPQ